METKLYVKEGVGFQGFYSKQRKSNKKGVFVIGLLVLIIGGIFVGPTIVGQATQEEVIVPSPTPFVTPTEIPTPTEVQPSRTVTVSPTLTPKPTVKVTPTVSPTPTKAPVGKDLTVEVLNGSGVKGAAQEAATLLEELGYTVSRTGNAGRFDYEGITILTKSKTVLDALKKELAKEYTISSSSATLTSTATVDARIIIGKE